MGKRHSVMILMLGIMISIALYFFISPYHNCYRQFDDGSLSDDDHKKVSELCSRKANLQKPGSVKARKSDIVKSNTQACSNYKSMADKVNAEGPVTVDHITRSDGIGVSCSLKLVDFKKSVKIERARLKPGWKEKQQRQLNDIVCKSNLLRDVRNGWKISSTTTFPDGSQFYIKAICHSDK